MGTGKTAVGEIVAKRLDRPLRDNDVTLRDRTGREAVQIEREAGLDALHALEAEALVADLATAQPAVVTAAASTVMDESARRALARDATVVWLDADPAASAARMAAGTHRPTHGRTPSEDPVDRVARLRAEREASFRSIADLVVDTTYRTPAEVASVILAHLATERDAAGSPRPS